MSVKRWNLPDFAKVQDMTMYRADQGDYVLHSDYAALQARYVDLRLANAALRNKADRLSEALEDFVHGDHPDETCPEQVMKDVSCRVCHAKRVLSDYRGPKP